MKKVNWLIGLDQENAMHKKPYRTLRQIDDEMKLHINRKNLLLRIKSDKDYQIDVLDKMCLSSMIVDIEHRITSLLNEFKSKQKK